MVGYGQPILRSAGVHCIPVKLKISDIALEIYKCFKIYKMITCCIPEATKGVKRCDPHFRVEFARRPRCAASPTPSSPPTSSLLIPPIAALPSSHRRQRRRGSAGWLARLLRRCIRRRRRRSSANLGSGQGGPKASASARRTPVARGHVARGQESPAGKRSVTSDGPLWFNKGFISTHHERDSCVAVRLQPPPPLKAARERTMAKDEPPRTTL